MDIFYNQIVKEAQDGRIDSYFIYNIIFNTGVENEYYQASNIYEGLLIPTLNIKNKKEFEQLLYEYVNLCLDFYDDTNFPEEILNDNLYTDHKICKEKTIMTLLFSNATIDDFNNPTLFLKRRIDFIKNTSENISDLGFCEILDCNLKIEIKKDTINNEMPYQFSIVATKDNEEFVFPSIKFGISDNRLYVYAIQNKKYEKNSLAKRINRILYKIGEGFDGNSDNYDIYEQGNLKDVTPSFVVASNIFLSYFYKLGINDVIISTILIERWNAKKIANYLKYKNNKLDLEGFKEPDDKQNEIQQNLTDKFIRTFLRLTHHYNGIEVESYPLEYDSNMHLSINDLSECNNYLLKATSDMVVQKNFTRR